MLYVRKTTPVAVTLLLMLVRYLWAFGIYIWGRSSFFFQMSEGGLPTPPCLMGDIFGVEPSCVQEPNLASP